MRYIVYPILALLLASCSDDSPVYEPENKTPEDLPALTAPEEYQQKIRTVPYPRQCNEIFINPAPLIVPRNMADGEAIIFELSTDSNFPADKSITSRSLRWNMFNAHSTLSAGTWYWHFRNVDADGNRGDWSETYSFEVKENTPSFVTPSFEQFIDRAPRVFPRLHCYSAATVDEARATITAHSEYKSILQRVAAPLNTDYSTLDSFYLRAEELSQHVEWLYQAYYLTQRQEYAAKLLQIYKSFVANPPAEALLYSENFTTSNLLFTLAACYDICYPFVDAATRSAAACWMADVVEKNFDTFRGYEENHIFDNHFWQQNYRHFFQACLVLFDNPEQGTRVLPMLEYLYELWTSRAPAGGFNRDGMWHNGTGYFNANVKTLCYMPLMFSYITGHDFMRHPWYVNAGRAMSFTIPPTGTNVGFGDASENRQSPNGQMASFADFIAYQTGDSYAAWYADKTKELLPRDYEMRIYRVCRGTQEYAPGSMEGNEMLQWNRDCGEVAMHSNLFDSSTDLALGFRASTFGSGSHTTASQNAFNVSYGGMDVFRSSGYYQNFSDAHNLLSYRHTRAHNTILVNGIGQPYSTRGWGRMLRAGTAGNIAYALGDASHAYCGVSDDPMWESAFAAAGIEQTPRYGFGPTPLSKYLRHVTMLGTDAIVIYDEIEASEKVTVDWLLHCREQFVIDREKNTIEVSGNGLPYKARVTFFNVDDMTMSQTDRWTAPPAIEGEQYPRQWHFRASVMTQSTRYLAVIQVVDGTSDFAVLDSTRNGLKLGDWSIEARLDKDSEASLCITNSSTGTLLHYGSSPVIFNGTEYRHAYRRSTIIADSDNQTLELNDIEPQSSRSISF